MRFIFESIRTVRSRCGLFLNRHHHTTANASTPTLTQPPTQRRQHILTRTHTTKHKKSPFPAQMQAHVTPSGTRLAQLCQDSCFLHDANMFAKQGMSQSTGTLTLRQVRALCTQREPTGRVTIVIVAESREREKKERREQRKRTREREKEERRKRERRRDERKRGRENLLPPFAPCVGSKRLRVKVLKTLP